MAYFDDLEEISKKLEKEWKRNKGVIWDIARETGISATTLYNIISRAHPTRAHTLRRLQSYFDGEK